MSWDRSEERTSSAFEETTRDEQPFVRLARVAVTLAPDPASVAMARRQVDRLLEGKSCGDIGDRLKLVVSELVANAVVHGHPEGEIQLNVVLHRLHVHVSVRNLGRPINMTAFRSGRPGSGRGLNMVGELVDSWTIETGTTGTTVSARLDRAG